MTAALDVFKAISTQIDSDFLAIDVLPILWQFGLGPLLNLQQFQAYMAVIKSMSTRVENEHTRKLEELGANNATSTSRNEFMSFGGPSTNNGFEASNGNGETDFETLVRGGQQGALGGTDMLGGNAWSNTSASPSMSTTLSSRPLNNATASNKASPAAIFSWSTLPISPPSNSDLSVPPAQTRTITPDNTLNSLNYSFPALSASNPGIGSSSYTPTQQHSQPAMSMNGTMPSSTTSSYHASHSSPSINWSKSGGVSTTSTTWGNSLSTPTTTSNLSHTSSTAPNNPYSSFSIAPPPLKPSGNSSFSISLPPSVNQTPHSNSGIGVKSTISSKAHAHSHQHKQTQNKQPDWANGGDSLI